jgi:hypothetical protein
MGQVYRARDTRLDRHVAIKVLPPDLTRDVPAKQRFVLEAKAASVLDHPNICTIHEIDETADGQLYLVMASLEHPQRCRAEQEYSDCCEAAESEVAGETRARPGIRTVHGRWAARRGSGECLQRKRDVPSRLKSPVGIFFETVTDDAVETRERSERAVVNSGGSSRRIAVIVSAAVPPLNARWPLNIS